MADKMLKAVIGATIDRRHKYLFGYRPSLFLDALASRRLSKWTMALS